MTERRPESGTADTIDASALALASQLCFALYSTSRSMTAAYRPFLERMGITYPQYLALLALWERPDVTMKELGEQLRLDYGTVSPLVARLTAHGLVESARSSTDGRAVTLRATAASADLRGQAVEMISAMLGGVDYSIEEAISLRREVNTLGERLDSYIARRREAES